MVRQIDIEIFDYSERLGLSDVERTIKSAANCFPNLSSEIDKLSIFVFNSEQIEEGTDIEKISYHTGPLPMGERLRWNLMYSLRYKKNAGWIEVNIEKFMNSSDTERKFIARHELGHIFLCGPVPPVPQVMLKKHKWILGYWKEFKVNSLMMGLFPELTIQYMHENPQGFSKLKNGNDLNRYQASDERILVVVKKCASLQMELTVLKKAPSPLKKKAWKTIEKLHLERMEFIKRQASQIRPQLKDICIWFTEECLENPELLVRRILELSFLNL